MPTSATLLAYCATALVVLLVPGPAVMYIAARSTVEGRRAGVLSVLGIHTGTLVHVAAAAAGLSAVLVASAAAFTAVKLLGGAYLIWLGVRVLIGLRKPLEVEPPVARTSRRVFADAFVISVLNPKVALFFLALLPQFVDPGRGGVLAQTLVLGVIFVLLGIVTDGAYALAGARLGAWLRRRPRVRRRGEAAEGVVLVGLGLTTLATPYRR